MNNEISSIVRERDLLPFTPFGEPYLHFKNLLGDAFEKNKAVRQTLEYVLHGTFPTTFKWLTELAYRKKEVRVNGIIPDEKEEELQGSSPIATSMSHIKHLRKTHIHETTPRVTKGKPRYHLIVH
jgi:hypothetical protein